MKAQRKGKGLTLWIRLLWHFVAECNKPMTTYNFVELMRWKIIQLCLCTNARLQRLRTKGEVCVQIKDHNEGSLYNWTQIWHFLRSWVVFACAAFARGVLQWLKHSEWLLACCYVVVRVFWMVTWMWISKSPCCSWSFICLIWLESF